MLWKKYKNKKYDEYLRQQEEKCFSVSKEKRSYL